MQLNEDQKRAFDNIVNWVKTPNQTYRTLSGYAGTGKTFMLNHLTTYLRDNMGKKIMVSAPTNKAVKVLKQKVQHNNFSTIHSFLAIRPQKTGKHLVFKPVYKEQPDIQNYNVWIIDECSMIENELLKFIDNAVEKQNPDIKILFVGDPAQLPPVDDDVRSRSFEHDGDKLIKIVRYGDSIAQKAKILRNNKNEVSPQQLINDENIRFVESLSEIIPYFKDFRKRPDENRFACYTNARVKYWNYLLRNIDYGKKMDSDFCVGDIVMANDTCQDENDEIIMQNSQEGFVADVRTQEDYTELKVLLEHEKVAYVRILNKKYKPELDKRLKAHAEKKEWSNFWNLKNHFHDIRHCYALTTHKHQGSTYKNIFLDINDIYSQFDAKERNQLLYVAMTRATDSVFFYDSRKIKK